MLPHELPKDLTQHSDDSTASPPPKKAKHLEVHQLKTTSSNAALSDDRLNNAEHLQQSTQERQQNGNH